MRASSTATASADATGTLRAGGAKRGKWTGGPLPFGYDVDVDGCLIPWTRILAGVEQPEMEAARNVFERLANGSTLVAEAKRLNALGVPCERHFAGDRPHKGRTGSWTAGRLHRITRNPVNKGTSIFRSSNGNIERPAPALVPVEVWDRVQAQLTRNRALAKRNARRLYLLRGLIRCGACGLGFGGNGASIQRNTYYYRCVNRTKGVSAQTCRRARSRW